MCLWREFYMKDKNDWANAIALRITDELSTKNDFPEDVDILRNVLEKLFAENEWAIEKVVGTGIIEDNYFEKLN